PASPVPPAVGLGPAPDRATERRAAPAARSQVPDDGPCREADPAPATGRGLPRQPRLRPDGRDRRRGPRACLRAGTAPDRAAHRRDPPIETRREGPPPLRGQVSPHVTVRY